MREIVDNCGEMCADVRFCFPFREIGQILSE